MAIQVQAYEDVVRDVLRLATALWIDRLSRELWDFAEPFAVWLGELEQHPTPRWRESLQALLAEQRSQGREVTPASYQEIVACLEAWARAVESRGAANSSGEVQEPLSMAGNSAIDPRLIALEVTAGTSGRRRDYRSPAWFFSSRLAEAQRQLDELGRLLDVLGRKLDAGKTDEAIDVQDDVDAIENSIWRYNDAIESAMDAWLRDDLPRDAMARLDTMRTPLALGLPMFFDEQQTWRRNQLGMQVNARLRARNVTMDRVMCVAEKVEQAGQVGGLFIGGGIVVRAFKKGGTWAVVKMLAVAGAAAAGEQGVEHGLRSAGADETEIRGARLAAVVAALIILRRRSAASPTKRPSHQGSPRLATSEPTTPNSSAASRGEPRGLAQDLTGGGKSGTNPTSGTDKSRAARLPQKGTKERAAIEKARRDGINAKKAQELASIRAGGKGSGVWTEVELQQIRKTGQFPRDAQWHHDPTVANRPDLASDPNVVQIIRGGSKAYLEAHGGDFRRPYPDEVSDP